MKTLKVTISSGEIILSVDDIKFLKPIIDEAFANLDDSDYARIKKIRSAAEVNEELDKMSDGELYHFAKVNEEFFEFRVWKADPFTLKIWAEIFKRNNLGYKQVGHLSTKQKTLLESLGLKYRKSEPTLRK